MSRPSLVLRLGQILLLAGLAACAWQQSRLNRETVESLVEHGGYLVADAQRVSALEHDLAVLRLRVAILEAQSRVPVCQPPGLRRETPSDRLTADPFSY